MLLPISDNPIPRADWYEMLAAAEAMRGRIERAAAWADQADAWSAGLPRRTGLARLARAHSLLPDDPAAAVAHARQAVELLTRSGDRVAAGRARLHAGIALAATGEPDPRPGPVRRGARCSRPAGRGSSWSRPSGRNGG